MLLSLLHYLSDPVYFGVFSGIVGFGYIGIWVFSLRELGRGEQVVYVRQMSEETDNGKKKVPTVTYGSNRNKIISRTPYRGTMRTIHESKRKARITRPATRAA
ncbi:MAG TPA: hypothetical protein VM123_15610 [archaeon]|nr:hypothetical protein [archaeon]